VIERLWRVRKDTHKMDARVEPAGDDARVVLTIYYDSQLITTTSHPSRADAAGEAARRLRDLLRAGWTSHW